MTTPNRRYSVRYLDGDPQLYSPAEVGIESLAGEDPENVLKDATHHAALSADLNSEWIAVIEHPSNRIVGVYGPSAGQ